MFNLFLQKPGYKTKEPRLSRKHCTFYNRILHMPFRSLIHFNNFAKLLAIKN